MSTDTHDYTLTRLAGEIRAELRDEYELVYVDYGDQLTDEQVNALVSHDWEKFDALFDEYESEARWHSVKYILDDLSGDILDRWERDAEDGWDTDEIEIVRAEFPYSDTWEELRYEIEERDTSDWIKRLARNTPDVLMRVAIEDFDGSAIDKDEDGSTAEDLLTLAGLPVTAENLFAAESIIANADTYGTLYYLFAASVSDLMDAGAEDSIVVVSPHVLLSNVYAGNGYEEEMTGEVTIKASDLKTDKGAFGYSWNEITGVYTSAYSADLRVIKSDTGSVTV